MAVTLSSNSPKLSKMSRIEPPEINSINKSNTIKFCKINNKMMNGF